MIGRDKTGTGRAVAGSDVSWFKQRGHNSTDGRRGALSGSQSHELDDQALNSLPYR